MYMAAFTASQPILCTPPCVFDEAAISGEVFSSLNGTVAYQRPTWPFRFYGRRQMTCRALSIF